MVNSSESAEREGFEPPVPQAVQQISSLPHSTTLPSLRGERILLGNALLAAHVAAQYGRDDDSPVALLEVFEDRDERAADGEA